MKAARPLPLIGLTSVSFSPLQLESLRQHSPVGSVGTGGVQAAADLLPDEVGDLEGAGPRQGRGVAVHQQELGVHGPGVLAERTSFSTNIAIGKIQNDKKC